MVGLSLLPDQELTPHALRSIYVKFFITTLEHRVEDLARIKREEIRFLEDTLILKIPLDDLRQVKKSKLTIDTIIIKFEDGSQKLFFLDTEYYLAALLEQEPPLQIPPSKRKFAAPSKIQYTEQSTISHLAPKKLVVQEEIISSPQKSHLKEPVFNLEEHSPKAIQHHIEDHVEEHVEKHLPRLKASPSELIVNSLNLLLSNLPTSEEEESGLLVGSMVSSIRKYLDEDIHRKKGEL